MLSRFEVFWYLAGLWNMAIAASPALWHSLTFHDKVTGSLGARIAVFLFGIGYACVGADCDNFWWVIVPLGAVLKLRLGFQHFKENKRLGRDANPKLTNVLIGDAFWGVGFISWLVLFGIYGVCSF